MTFINVSSNSLSPKDSVLFSLNISPSNLFSLLELTVLIKFIISLFLIVPLLTVSILFKDSSFELLSFFSVSSLKI